MANDTRNAKPNKPYPDFPLFPHERGQWAKKIKGKMYYFGRWEDWQGAIAKYEWQKTDLYAGRKPRPFGEATTRVKDVVNAYLTAQKTKLDAGAITSRTWAECFATCERIAEAFGKDRPLADMRVEDFDAYRVKIAARWGAVRQANEIQRVRTVMKYAFEAGLVDVPVRCGPNFKKPSRRIMRQERNARPRKAFTAEEIRAILDAAGIQMRAMVLLGINCGWGNTDIAGLNWSHLDLVKGIAVYPRQKTGIDRRAILWPETVEALRKLREWSQSKHTTGEARGLPRYRPADAADADAVFLTKHQRRFVVHTSATTGEGEDAQHRERIVDSVGLAFRKLLATVKVAGEDGEATPIRRAGVGFYSLRHTFQTIAEGARDLPAVRRIMGHIDDSIDDHYREWGADAHEDTRLRHVADHVHAWLYGKA